MSDLFSAVKNYPNAKMISAHCTNGSVYFKLFRINEGNVLIEYPSGDNFRIPDSLDVKATYFKYKEEDRYSLDIIAHYEDKTSEHFEDISCRDRFEGHFSVEAISFYDLYNKGWGDIVVPHGVKTVFFIGTPIEQDVPYKHYEAPYISFGRLEIPQSVHEFLIKNASLKAEQIVFNGDLPDFKLDNNSADFNRDDFIKEEIRINTPKKEVALPTFLAKAIERPMDSRRGPRKVIYSAPKLCEEESINPGYIRVTEITEDNIVEINTRYIFSVEPLDIDRFEPVVGARIYLGADADNYRRYYDVYEPQDMVVSKIREAVKKIDPSTLIAHFETLLNAKKFK